MIMPSLKTDSELNLQVPITVIPDNKNMEHYPRIRTCIRICLFLAIAGIIGFSLFCSEENSSKHDQIIQSKFVACNDHTLQSFDNTVQQTSINNPGLSYDEVLTEDLKFNIEESDVMVFLHIQKTGGTSFGRHLVHDLDLKRPCKCSWGHKRCHCLRPKKAEVWLFSRYSTGWQCGLHADWTELTNCVDQKLNEREGESAKRRYFYVTLLREPIDRYLSEFQHIRRGATWNASKHRCLGREPTAEELPPCYNGSYWFNATIEKFIGCESNLAANRQTRMLADLALIGCYNKSFMAKNKRDEIMLASAQRNLAGMAYFGLTEYQKISQYVFEETFNLRYSVQFEQKNITISMNVSNTLSPEQRKQIEKVNALDIKLYSYAKSLLFQRFEHLKAKDKNFKQRFANLGYINRRHKNDEYNWN